MTLSSPCPALTYTYPRPALAVDCVVFGLDDEALKVMLIQRDLLPFVGQWALPGGFVRVDESLDSAARRELQEETGLHDIFLEQLYTFGDLGRDPRDRVVTVAYYALVSLRDHPHVKATTDARAARWFAIADVPSLAFDHDRILAMALERLRGKIRYEPIGFELLPAKFTLTQLQSLYETVLGQALDKRNFRKKILAMNLLVALDETETGVRHRAARLYRFDGDRYAQLRQQGIHFEI